MRRPRRSRLPRVRWPTTALPARSSPCAVSHRTMDGSQTDLFSNVRTGRHVEDDLTHGSGERVGAASARVHHEPIVPSTSIAASLAKLKGTVRGRSPSPPFSPVTKSVTRPPGPIVFSLAAKRVFIAISPPGSRLLARELDAGVDPEQRARVLEHSPVANPRAEATDGISHRNDDTRGTSFWHDEIAFCGRGAPIKTRDHSPQHVLAGHRHKRSGSGSASGEAVRMAPTPLSLAPVGSGSVRCLAQA